jgi:hypothetical protein
MPRTNGTEERMSQLAPGPIYQRHQPVRDDDYKRFIKRLPCVGCLKTWGIDPAHTGPHGIGQKSCDLSCIPLCRTCHRDYDAAPLKFATRKLDIPALIKQFNEFYRDKIKPEAA